jgi:hypothetical protein
MEIMKKSKFILATTTALLLLLWVNQGFSQGNSPLEEKDNGVFKVKTKAEMAKNFDKLSQKVKPNMKRQKMILKKSRNPHSNLLPMKF